AAPTMDQITGKATSPMATENSSGRFMTRAIHTPSTAPMNPSATDTRHPPREYPVIAWPSAPQTPAINNSSKKSRTDTTHAPFSVRLQSSCSGPTPQGEALWPGGRRGCLVDEMVQLTCRRRLGRRGDLLERRPREH